MRSDSQVDKVFFNQLIINTLEVNFVNIEVYNEKTLYKGSGQLLLNENGSFLVELETDLERLEPSSKSFKLKAFDQDGNFYESNSLYLKKLAKILIFDVKSLIEVSSTNVTQTRAIFFGDYKLPMNCTYSHTGTNNYFWEFQLNENIALKLFKFENYIDLVIQRNPEDFQMDYEYIKNLISSLDFILGIETEPIYIGIEGRGFRMLKKRSMLLAKSTVFPPVRIDNFVDKDFTTNHSNLFRKYFEFLSTHSGTKSLSLSIIHKRIVGSSRSYVYVYGLTLCVLIEAISKDYYPEFYKPDEKFIEALIEAIMVLEDYGDPDTKGVVVEKLKYSIPKNQRNNLNVRNILKNLKGAGIITDPSLISSWESLRNFTAHGSEVEGNDYEKFMDNLMSCSRLYYQLVFGLINYSGEYQFISGKNEFIDDHYKSAVEID